jgi:hypothetical protein
MFPKPSRILLWLIIGLVTTLTISLIGETSLLPEEPIQTPDWVSDPNTPGKAENIMARKTSRPPSWLTVIQNARTVFIGEAVVTADVKVPATETSFRGAGYRITAQISPQQLLLGSLPGETIELQGETRRSPEARLTLTSALFPPDTLHRIDYWDYAHSNGPQRVLVVLSEPTIVQVLEGQADDLPQAVVKVHAWLQLPAKDQKAVVLEDLSQSVYDPIAYLAGFELLMAQQADLAVLFETFNKLPARPGAAIQGIVDRLYSAATSLPEPAIKALSRQLLASWTTENDPAALSSYLIWFDAHRQRTWQADQTMRAGVLAEAERARSMSFSGAQADQWAQQVRYYASVLVNNSKN